MQRVETSISPDEAVLPRDIAQAKPVEPVLYSESARVEMAEVGTIFTGMTISLLMGLVIWLAIVIAIVVIF